MITSLPNLLSLSRIGVVPVVVALFYWDSPVAGWVACGLFSVACITDFFDGYVARSRRQATNLGRILDPIADKLLVGAAIIMLVAFDKAPVLPALVILCRELFVSGLREFLAKLRVGVPVSRLAKWKTTVQMVAIAFLLVGDSGPVFVEPYLTAWWVGGALLWLAAGLSLVTGYDYLRAGLKHLMAASAKVEAGERRAASVRAAKPSSTVG
ncbi:MAG: CDP-diacylglycerol--glycerol-3-phosphate 3-phosphatidyltransferase [Alphaproteobacteria bacterium]